MFLHCTEKICVLRIYGPVLEEQEEYFLKLCHFRFSNQNANTASKLHLFIYLFIFKYKLK